MKASVRAVVSVALLLGFYVYAVGIVVLFAAPTAWLISRGIFNYGVDLLIGLALLVAGSVGYATWRVVWASRSPEPGLLLTEQRAPALWATVRELAAGVGTRPPDEIRLVAMVNAAVSEHSRWLGLASGRRYLHIGLPLLQAMTVAQVRATLAHELGHYSHQHIRLAEPIHRGQDVIQQTLEHLPQDERLPTWLARLPRWLLFGYAWTFFLVSAAIRRTQEVEADLAAVRLAGRRAAISEQREYPALTAAWRFYLESYVMDGLESGFAPVGVLSYFPTLLAARAGELAEIRAQAPPALRSRWDTHPSDAERIAVMERAPEAPIVVDDRPAGVLVPHLDAAAAQLEELSFDFGDRTRVPFGQYRAAAAQWDRQRVADRLYRAAARVTGGEPSLATVLDLLAAGGLRELTTALLPAAALGSPPAAAEKVIDALARAIAAALVRCAAARWQGSWSGPTVLVGGAGEPVDTWDVATRAVSGEATKVRDELLTAGVDLTGMTAERTTAPATGAKALAGITNAVVNRARRDVIVTSVGLAIIPTLPWLRQNTVQQRMRKLLTEVPVATLASEPGHRFIAYEEIATAAVARRFPATFDFVLRSGERLRIRFGRKSDEVGEGWQALGQATAMLTPPS